MNKIKTKISTYIFGLGVFLAPNLSYSMQEFDFLTKINSFDDKEKVEFVKNNIEAINKQRYLKTIGNIIDETNDDIINEYANREKRLPPSIDEEKLIIQIKSMPPYMYQYIGPYLHETVGISEKILNMPGIKETKGTFPTRISPHLKDFVKQYGQFLSPRLYFVLMPEAWPSQNKTPVEKIEPQKQKRIFTSTEINDDLIIEANKHFYDAYFNDKKLDTKQLRTIGKITKSSPLTTGDAQAFLDTMTELRKLESNKKYKDKIYNAKKNIKHNFDGNTTNVPTSTLRDMINPCQRLVSAVKFSGEENKFELAIAKKGFTIDEWAYTCDKTIKAHRLAQAYPAVISFLRGYKKGYYQKINLLQAPSIRETIDAAQRMYFEMHQSTVDDVIAVRKLKQQISKEFVGKDNEYLFTFPITAIY